MFCILPTVLRGFVPAVRVGIRKVVWGLRLLQGRCVSGIEAVVMKIEPGSRPLLDEDVEEADEHLIEGLSMVEGKHSHVNHQS